MPSRFAPRQAFIHTGGAKILPKRVANLSLGADTYSDFDEMQDGASPNMRNGRATQLGKLSTRKGAGFYSVPIGETINASQIGVTGAADQSVGLVNWLADKFVPSSAGRLTRLDINIKAPASPVPTGPIIIEIHSDSSGSPSPTVLGTSSVKNPATSYGYLTARFIEAPLLASGTTYWVVAYTQDTGSNFYNWSSTSAVSTAKTSANSGSTWTATSYGLNYKTYLSADSPVLGHERYVQSSGTKTTVMFHGTSAYTVNDITGATTVVDTGLNASATNYYTEIANDILFYVNGYDAPRQLAGTAASAVLGSPPISILLKNHKNRHFFVSASDPSRVVYSEAGDFSTYLSTSFIYVPTPKSPDPIVGMEVLQDNLYFFTKKTKYVLQGSDPSSFVLRRATGIKGSVNQDCIRTDGFYIYFASDDGMYRFNGAIDERLDLPISPNYKTIAQPSKITSEFRDQKWYVFSTSAGVAQNNQCFVWDNALNGWFPDDGQYVGRCRVWRTSQDSNQFVLGSSVVGALYYGEQQDSDLGRPIAFVYDTKDDSFGTSSHLKQVKKFFPMLLPVSGSYGIKISYALNASGSYTGQTYSLAAGGTTFANFIIGTSALGLIGLPDIKITVPGFIKRVRFRFERTGVDTPVEILGYEFEFTIKRSR